MDKVVLVANVDWALYRSRLPLARALRETGYEAVLVCPAGPYVPRLRSAGFRVLEWGLDRPSLNPFREVQAVVQLARLYRQEAPLVAHHFSIKPILYGSVAARWAGVPRVINSFTGLGFVFSQQHAAERLRAMLRPLLRSILRHRGSLAVFQSAAHAARFQRWGLVSPGRTRLVAGSGVDLEEFSPSSNGARSHEMPVVVMASRLLLDKGVREYVAAARELRSRGCHARFLLAGDSDPGNPSCVPDDVIAGWRRDRAVEFLGHREDIAEVLRKADLAVLPSYHEGVPRFLIEAAASGLPIVASDIEGCRTVVSPGVNGLLVPPRDAAGLGEAIQRLLDDPGLRVKMGRAGRERAVERFGEHRVIQEYLTIYGRG